MSGVVKVIRFNWPVFVSAAAIAVGGCIVATPWALAMTAIATVGIVNALVATYWAYDRSELYRFAWLTAYAAAPRRILRVHTGLDEARAGVAAVFPGAEQRVCDVYDPRYVTEPSIARARASASGAQATRLAEIGDGWADLTIGFLALHEVRDATAREALFAELRRTVRDGGLLVIVEHLRDLANLAVYGPGAFHFLPRSAWMRATSAGFVLEHERRISPFIRVFAFEAA